MVMPFDKEYNCSNNAVSAVGYKEIVSALNLDEEFKRMVKDLNERFTTGGGDNLHRSIRITHKIGNELFRIFSMQQISAVVIQYLKNENDGFLKIGMTIKFNGFEPFSYPPVFAVPIPFPPHGSLNFSLSIKNQ